MSNFLQDIAPEVIFRREGKISYRLDPMPELLARGLLSPLGPGLFLFRGALAGRLAEIERCFFDLSRALGAEELAVPSVLDLKNAERTGYLSSFADQALILQNTESQAVGLACPNVCFHYFSYLSSCSQPCEQLVSALASCSRNESAEPNSLERLRSFKMREIIGIGAPEFCKEKRIEILERTKKIFTEVFDLSFSIETAHDHFLGEDSGLKAKAQLLEHSKYELRAVLPYKKESLALASFNLHGSGFFEKFSLDRSQVSHSFCVGFGYERILLALLSQQGLEDLT